MSLDKTLTNVEGDLFWKTHLGINRTVPFPLLFDMVTEEFRNKTLAVVSLACFGLFFFYLAVFDKLNSKLSCLSPQLSYEHYLCIDGVFFKGSYAVLGLWGLMGNLKRYPLWLCSGTVLWIVWSLLCLTYNLQSCDFGTQFSSLTSVRFYNFLGFCAAHFLLAISAFLGCFPTLTPSFSLPIRISTSIFLSIWLISTLFISVTLTQTVQTIISLFEIVHYLNDMHFDTGSGADKVRSAIKPLPYALLTGNAVAVLVCLGAMWSLYHNYRLKMAHIVRKQGKCKWLRKAWTVGTHNGMFFIVQFVANCFYLYIILLYTVTTVAFFLYSAWFYEGIWEYIEVRPIWIPLLVLCFIGKWVYLPRLVERETNRIRNEDYYNFWTLIYSIFGILMAVIRGSGRMIAGVIYILWFGYRSDVSVFPIGLESYDSLYTAYCGMVIIHCLEAGISPD